MGKRHPKVSTILQLVMAILKGGDFTDYILSQVYTLNEKNHFVYKDGFSRFEASYKAVKALYHDGNGKEESGLVSLEGSE